MKRPTKNSLLIIVIGSLILILILTVISPSVMRMALSLPLILFFPGYGITAILFPRRALDIPARLLLSVGLSLATTAFSGLILHLTPWGIRLQNPWIVLLLGGTGLVGAIFLVVDALSVDRTRILTRIGFSSRQASFIAFAVVIAVIAMNVARTPASPQNLAGYTLLWIQPGDVPDRVELGIRSEEFATTKYRLEFEIKDVVREGPTFELKPGETWEGFSQLSNEVLKKEEPITVLLYRLDNPDEVYRRVEWWYENH